MRCVRSIACISTAGFHHGSSRKTYSAAVRFSPTPPALRLIRKSGHAGVALEARDPFRAIAGLTVEVLVDDAIGVEPLPQQREQARELREDERLAALRDQLRESWKQQIELR